MLSVFLCDLCVSVVNSAFALVDSFYRKPNSLIPAQQDWESSAQEGSLTNHNYGHMFKKEKGRGQIHGFDTPRAKGGIKCQEEIERVRWDKGQCQAEVKETAGEPQHTIRRRPSAVGVAA